jgi:2-keto-4-pentenoate hydratase/2-oxohepta-3-ene-1,7-dioic acid hydratase in catechol pathway
MKLVTFTTGTDARLGALRGEGVIDLAVASEGRLPSDMLTFLRRGGPAVRLAREIVDQAKTALSLHQVTLLAPVPNPSKVIAIGLNYMDHCLESGAEPPTSPVIFAKFPTSIIGPGETIRWDPALTAKVDYEAELAVVIGRTARRVSEAEAYDCVVGYTNANDVSARDLQRGDGQWVRAKSLDTFCPLGPYLATCDEIPEPQNLTIRSVLNGQVMQDSNTSNLIFGIAELIAFSSRAFTLLPGDILVTGTPHGVGVSRDPPVFLQDGDVISIEVQGLGTLTNPCAEEGN